MRSLRSYVLENANAARGARKKPRHDRGATADDDEPVQVIRSLGLDAATVALPAGIDLETRAARMNEFWRALVEFQYRDAVVVALCGSQR